MVEMIFEKFHHQNNHEQHHHLIFDIHFLHHIQEEIFVL
jgi:hypothetical protein